MLDALDLSTRNVMDVGALNAVQGRSRSERVTERIEAMKQGRTVGDQQDLEKKVRGVAEDFVGVFMNQVMKSMRATVNENPEMHGDNGEKFFQEMLDTEYSKSLSKGSGYGLTDLIYESLMTSYRVGSEVPVAQADPAQQAGKAAQDAWDAEAATEAPDDLVVAAMQ